MAVTLQDIRDIGYNILREEQDSSAYPLSLFDLMANSAEQRICHGRVVNPINGDSVRKGTLSFLLTDQWFTSRASKSLGAAATVGGTTLTVTDADDWDDLTEVYINGDIISYTGASSTQFIGVTGISFAHANGSTVLPAFSFNGGSIVNVIRDYKYQMRNRSYEDIFEQLNSNKGRRTARNIYGTETYVDEPFYCVINNSYIVLFNIDIASKSIRVRYEKEPTGMTASTDTATIDNDIYAKTTIPYLAVGEMLYNRNEEQRAAEIFNFAINQVREMYDYYNTLSMEKQSGKQYKIAKGYLNI